jgi:hypothetical protein
VRAIKRIVAAAFLLYIAALGFRIYARKFYIWLPGYMHWSTNAETAAGGAPVQVFFFFTDHFEPGSNSALVEEWTRRYPGFAARHRDSAGRRVQHNWFYPGEQPIDANLTALQSLVKAGLGEVELHLHHGNDTQESTRQRVRDSIAWFQKFGFLKGTDGKTHFAFIHGNWSLDNSRGKEFCGADREIELLREAGCFADFTFPSLWQVSQPATVNEIYMAADDDRPKSYDHGSTVRAGSLPSGDLMIFPGPLVIAPVLDPRKLFFWVEDSDIHASVPTTERRVDYWVRAGIHVAGKPDWIFIKVHSHTAASREEMEEALGGHFDRALSYLETRYNDGKRYVLHYVTAREAYNLARAAADGRSGPPRQYLNYAIPPYVTSAAEAATPAGAVETSLRTH